MKELEEMDSLDTTTQMSKDYPSVMDTFVHERDQLVFLNPSLYKLK